MTLAAGALSGTDPAPGTDFVTPFYALSVQRVIKRYFVVEGEVSHWAHTLRVERGAHDIFGPAGVIGSVTSSTVVDAHSTLNIAAHLLLQSTGKVRVFAGGGAGLSIDNTEYRNKALAVHRRWTRGAASASRPRGRGGRCPCSGQSAALKCRSPTTWASSPRCVRTSTRLRIAAPLSPL